MVRTGMAAALVVGFAAAAAAQTTDQAAVLARIGERGALLYAFDQAAWHATDDLRARRSDFPAGLGGYVVDGTTAEPHAIFFDPAGARMVYTARFRDGRLEEARLFGPGDDATLSATVRRMIAARATATAAIAADATATPCAAQPFNTVVVPPADPEAPITVYFMTPQVTADAVPFGGHYAVDVDASGKAGPVRRFTRACLDIPVDPPAAKGAKPVGVFVTQIVGDLPTEIHVFQSLTLRRPVMVGAGEQLRVWPVVGAKIQPPVLVKR